MAGTYVDSTPPYTEFYSKNQKSNLRASTHMIYRTKYHMAKSSVKLLSAAYFSYLVVKPIKNGNMIIRWIAE